MIKYNDPKYKAERTEIRKHRIGNKLIIMFDA